MGLGDAWRRGESGVPRIEMGRRCAHPNPPMFPVQSRTLLQSDCERVTDRHTHSGCHVPVSGGSAKSICGTPKLYCSTNFGIDRKGDLKGRVSSRPGPAPCWKSCAQANIGRPVSRTVDLRGSRNWQGVQHLLNDRPAGGLLGSGRGIVETVTRRRRVCDDLLRARSRVDIRSGSGWGISGEIRNGHNPARSGLTPAAHPTRPNVMHRARGAVHIEPMLFREKCTRSAMSSPARIESGRVCTRMGVLREKTHDPLRDPGCGKFIERPSSWGPAWQRPGNCRNCHAKASCV